MRVVAANDAATDTASTSPASRPMSARGMTTSGWRTKRGCSTFTRTYAVIAPTRIPTTAQTTTTPTDSVTKSDRILPMRMP